MSAVTAQSMTPLALTEKEIKSHAVRLMVWLWPKTETDLWPQKLVCGKTLADLTLRLPPVMALDTPVISNWAMIVAMMLNGTEHIYGDPDPFTIEPGKSPDLQAWRLLVINSLAFLPAEGYLMCNAARIALNTIDLSFDAKLRQNPSADDYGADIVHYLNYQGQGNSIAWFRALDVTQQHAALLERIPAALRVWQQSLDCFIAHLPKTSVLASCMTRHKYGLQMLITAAPKMIPLALKDVAGLLRPLQLGIPANAEKQFGARAAIPYQLKNMTPNPCHSMKIDIAEIENVFATYARTGAAEKVGAL